MMKILIIQTSLKHTASTFLVNALYGIIPDLSDKPISKEWNTPKNNDFQENVTVLKSHDTNIDQLMETYGNKYRVFFVCSERPKLNKTLDDKYKYYPNVIMFDFDELNETNENTLEHIVDHIHDKLSRVIGIYYNKSTCLKRLTQMNAKYLEIKHYPFSYTDSFFELHGSHRDRLTSPTP